MYRLTSTWQLPAAPERVWDTITAVGDWPRWWAGVEATSLVRAPGPHGLGQRTHLVIRSPLGYRLRFGVEITEIDAPRLARARVVGDLRGTGAWTIAAAPSGSVATIDWHVRPTAAWLRAFGPLAVWAHARVMAAGECGLVTCLTSLAD